MLAYNIQNTKIMASGPITSWPIDGETMETVRDFICLESLSLACFKKRKSNTNKTSREERGQYHLNSKEPGRNHISMYPATKIFNDC